MMNNKTFADKAIQLSKQKTAYMLGGFGHIATKNNLNRLLNQYPENYSWVGRAQEIIGQGFCMDCCGMIKGLLWGFSGDLDKVYGGARYCSNNVPDIDADSLISACLDVTANLNNAVPGEVVWMPGHVGVVISSSQVVECTPSFAGGAQITNLFGRGWHKKGKLPYVDYSTAADNPSVLPPGQSNHAVPAQFFDRNLAKTYIVDPVEGLNIRKGPSTSYDIIKAVPKGTKLNNYGYYSKTNGELWLYIQDASDGVIGYVHSSYVY